MLGHMGMVEISVFTLYRIMNPGGNTTGIVGKTVHDNFWLSYFYYSYHNTEFNVLNLSLL
jgi:hypothetical protein